MYSERELSKKAIDAIAIVIGSHTPASLQAATWKHQKKAIEILMLDPVFAFSVSYYANQESVTAKEYIAVVVAIGLCLFANMKGAGSNPELTIASILDKAGIRYEREKTFEGMRDIGLLRLDFYLPDHDLAVEYQGKQHFVSIDYFGGAEALRETQRRDAIKCNYCKANGIEIKYINHDQDIEQELGLILQSLAV